jgi:hypothetical protein
MSGKQPKPKMASLHVQIPKALADELGALRPRHGDLSRDVRSMLWAYRQALRGFRRDLLPVDVDGSQAAAVLQIIREQKTRETIRRIAQEIADEGGVTQRRAVAKAVRRVEAKVGEL